MWADPQKRDFRLIEGCEFKTLGLFIKRSLRPLAAQVRALEDAISCRVGDPPRRLKWLASAMKQACDRLFRFPSTYRDACLQYRETQRYWLMVLAFIDYGDIIATSTDVPRPVRPEFLGCFTTQPSVVQQLFLAGFPVWFVRSDASVKGLHLNTTPLVKPSNICTRFGPFGGHEFYAGLSGSKHLTATARGTPLYLDVSHAPLLAAYTDGDYAPPPAQRLHRASVPRASSSQSSAASSQGPRNGGGPSRYIYNLHGARASPPCEYCVNYV